MAAGPALDVLVSGYEIRSTNASGVRKRHKPATRQGICRETRWFDSRKELTVELGQLKVKVAQNCGVSGRFGGSLLWDEIESSTAILTIS
jgi:hypothetical protein